MQETDYITKKYFDETFYKKMGGYVAEIKRHNEIHREAIQYDIKAMGEQLPTRQDVRDIVREELDIRVKPIESDIKVMKHEITSINKKLDINILETKSHGKRITKLEHVIQH